MRRRIDEPHHCRNSSALSGCTVRLPFNVLGARLKSYWLLSGTRTQGAGCRDPPLLAVERTCFHLTSPFIEPAPAALTATSTSPGRRACTGTSTTVNQRGRSAAAPPAWSSAASTSLPLTLQNETHPPRSRRRRAQARAPGRSSREDPGASGRHRASARQGTPLRSG